MKRIIVAVAFVVAIAGGASARDKVCDRATNTCPATHSAEPVPSDPPVVKLTPPPTDTE